jgi:hypothetical protein
MERMIRKQVYIEKQHEQRLKRVARERGVTEAEIIREAIDRVEMSRPPAGRVPDPEASRKFFAFIRAISRGPRRPLPRWNRESLYEERIGRWIKS